MRKKAGLHPGKVRERFRARPIWGRNGRVTWGLSEEWRLLRVVGRAPVHLFLVLVGVLWLVPTIGLFLTSLLSPQDYNNFGWWKVLSHPSLATWKNYSELLHHTDIPHALWTTVQIAACLGLLVGTFFSAFRQLWQPSMTLAAIAFTQSTISRR